MCTVYTLQCLHSVHCTLYTVYTVYNVQHWCTLYWHLYTSGCIEVLMYVCTSVQINQYTFVHNWLICSILVQLNICSALLYSCTHQSSCGLVTTLCSSHKVVRLQSGSCCGHDLNLDLGFCHSNTNVNISYCNSNTIMNSILYQSNTNINISCCHSNTNMNIRFVTATQI